MSVCLCVFQVEEMVETDELVRSVLSLVSNVSQRGAGQLLRSTNWTLLGQQLSTLSARGISGVMGEWLQSSLFTQFNSINISSFRCSLKTDPGAALDQLYKSFVEYSSLVRRCCESLRCPEQSAIFVVSVRTAVLEESPRELFDYLRAVGERILADLDRGTIIRDNLIAQIHGLSFTAARSVKALFRDLMKEVIQSRVDSLPENFSEPQVGDLVLWKARCIDVFTRMVLVANDRDLLRANARTELDTWSQYFDQYLHDRFAAKRIAALYDIIVEFPDSMQALQDLQLCLSRSSTSAPQDMLIDKARHILSSKLHHAGARTEDILTVVAATIRSFSVLFSKNEAGSVISSVVSDTLQCLKRRKDSVAAVVRAIVQQDTDSLLLSELQAFATANTSDDDLGQSPKGIPGGLGTEFSWRYQRPQDVLRILLSTFSINAIVQEYKSALASEILGKPPHDCIAESEVLERMKCIFGTECLAPCMVMLRDVQQSRRINSSHPKPTADDMDVNVLIISAASWPSLPTAAEGDFTCHPAFDRSIKMWSQQYHTMKPNQHLRWLNHLAKVQIEVTQVEPQSNRAVKFDAELGLFAASIILFVGDGYTSAADIAKQMKCEVDHVMKEACLHSPGLLVVHPNNNSLELQRYVTTQASFAFCPGAPTAENSTPSGISPAELDMYSNMICAMVKTGGTKSVTQIENSMKMFGKFQGTSAQVRALLQYLAETGKISQIDSNNFTAVKQK